MTGTVMALTITAQLLLPADFSFYKGTTITADRYDNPCEWAYYIIYKNRKVLVPYKYAVKAVESGEAYWVNKEIAEKNIKKCKCKKGEK